MIYLWPKLTSRLVNLGHKYIIFWKMKDILKDDIFMTQTIVYWLIWVINISSFKISRQNMQQRKKVLSPWSFVQLASAVLLPPSTFSAHAYRQATAVMFTSIRIWRAINLKQSFYKNNVPLWWQKCLLFWSCRLQSSRLWLCPLRPRSRTPKRNRYGGNQHQWRPSRTCKFLLLTVRKGNATVYS